MQHTERQQVWWLQGEGPRLQGQVWSLQGEVRGLWRQEVSEGYACLKATAGVLAQRRGRGAGANDVVDLRSGCQFYYHAHRQAGLEHGHLHLFWHASASGRRRYRRPGRPRWQRSAPTHLLAVSLDSRGLPIALFTVNRWVTDGHWFDAEAILEMVERFAMGDVEGYEHSCRWLTGFVRLYRPLIKELLSRRDQRLARSSDLKQALNDRRLEVLSTRHIDWMADLEALQEQASLRGLSYPA